MSHGHPSPQNLSEHRRYLIWVGVFSASLEADPPSNLDFYLSAYWPKTSSRIVGLVPNFLTYSSWLGISLTLILFSWFIKVLVSL